MVTIAEHQTGIKDRTGPTVPDALSSGLRSVIGRRLALATITFSTLLACVMTLFQLSMDFRAEKNLQAAFIKKLEVTILPALAESLWVLDTALINAHLAGIAQIDGVGRVQVTGADDVFIVTNGGEPTQRRVELPIIRRADGEAQRLGTLVVDTNVALIWDRVMGRAVLVLGANFLNTLCVAFVLLLLFGQLIGRHLVRLVEFADAYNPRQTGQRLALDTGGLLAWQRQSCEFDRLQVSINRWSQATETYLEQLRNTNQEQAEFSYAVSHDLKSPANTMSMLIEELKEEPDLTEDARAVLDEMTTTNKRMGDLVTDVLDYSRLVDGKFHREQVHLTPLVVEIEQDLSADIRAASASIHYENLPQIWGHNLQIRLLLQNLLANAIKFRKPGQPAVVHITTEQRSDATLVRVTDNGIGIPEKYQDRIFSLFTKLHTRAEYDGSGLGLSISRRVMSNHGGTIWVEEGIDGGTTFAVKFPRMSHD